MYPISLQKSHSSGKTSKIFQVTVRKCGKLIQNNPFYPTIYVFAYLFIQYGLQFIYNQNLAISKPKKVVHVKKHFTESKTRVLHIE